MLYPALQELRQAGSPGSCFKEGVQVSGSWGHGVCRHSSGQREVENGAVGESRHPLGRGLGCSRAQGSGETSWPRPVELEPGNLFLFWLFEEGRLGTQMPREEWSSTQGVTRGSLLHLPRPQSWDLGKARDCMFTQPSVQARGTHP